MPICMLLHTIRMRNLSDHFDEILKVPRTLKDCIGSRLTLNSPSLLPMFDPSAPLAFESSLISCWMQLFRSSRTLRTLQEAKKTVKLMYVHHLQKTSNAKDKSTSYLEYGTGFVQISSKWRLAIGINSRFIPFRATSERHSISDCTIMSNIWLQ